MAKRHQVVEQIIAMTDHAKGMFGGDRKPAQGQMVVTGHNMGWHAEKQIGFCVQIRTGRGQYGSDMVFLRHPDGSLTTHENQGYFAMTADQEKLARTIFTYLPEDEDYSVGYLCGGKVHETGFLIDKSTSSPQPNQPFNLVVESSDTDGTPKNTFIAHIG